MWFLKRKWTPFAERSKEKRSSNYYYTQVSLMRINSLWQPPCISHTVSIPRIFRFFLMLCALYFLADIFIEKHQCKNYDTIMREFFSLLKNAVTQGYFTDLRSVNQVDELFIESNLIPSAVFRIFSLDLLVQLINVYACVRLVW